MTSLTLRNPASRTSASNTSCPARTWFITQSELCPLTRLKSTRTTLPPGFRAVWIEAIVRCGNTKWWKVSQMNATSTVVGGSSAEWGLHRTVVTLFSPAASAVFATWARNFSAMSTAYTFPVGPTSAANSRVNSPVPAPRSAIAVPGFRPTAATISFRFA